MSKDTGIRLVALAFLALCAAGCNGGGLGGDGDAAVPVTTLTLLSGGSLGDFGMPEGDGEGEDDTDDTVDDMFLNSSDDDDSDDESEKLAKVHNPEPASMLLMGIGLAGLSRLRRKK